MNKHDHAILIGINTYPSMDKNNWLKYSISDVKKFKKWLLSDTGGKLNKSNITELCFPDEELVKGNPRPTESDYFSKFADYMERSINIINKDPEEIDTDKYYIEDGEVYYGRRIYLYFSGHGFANNTNKDDNALLTADGNYDLRIKRHVNGWKYSQLLESIGIFKEIVLLMDCCRTVPRGAAMNTDFPIENIHPDSNRTIRTMRAYSSQYTRISQEKEDFEGGVFTHYLIKALENAPSVNAKNEITYSSFERFFYNLTKETNQKPVLACGAKSAEMVLYIKENLPEIIFSCSDECMGKTLFIKDMNLKIIADLTTEINQTEITLFLEAGLYAYEIEDSAFKGIIDVKENTTYHVG